MLTRNCPVKNGKSCRGAANHLRDRKGIDFIFAVQMDFPNCSIQDPYILADRMNEVKNADFVLSSYKTEDKEQISSVFKAYQNGSSPEIGPRQTYTVK